MESVCVFFFLKERGWRAQGSIGRPSRIENIFIQKDVI